MTLAQIDTLELEIRKLDGVRAVGFSSAQDALYIQLFIDANASTQSLPFEATRIAKRHSNQNVAVEIVRTNFTNNPTSSVADNSFVVSENTQVKESAPSTFTAGTINITKQNETTPTVKSEETKTTKTATHADFFRPTGNVNEDEVDFVQIPSNSFNEDPIEEEEIEINLEEETIAAVNSTPVVKNDNSSDRIELLLVSTSPENDEIEIHLSYNDTRTIGRAPSNRGLLGAIDATISAINELSGIEEFHGEWARSLEPGAEHASLVAVGLINDEGTETRHGIAGGSSPIEAAARATLNALNRIASLSNA
jgi:hypothetical protein